MIGKSVGTGAVKVYNKNIKEIPSSRKTTQRGILIRQERNSMSSNGNSHVKSHSQTSLKASSAMNSRRLPNGASIFDLAKPSSRDFSGDYEY